VSNDPRSALNELRAAIYLDPESITGSAPESLAIQGDYAQALRAAAPPPAAVKSAPAARGPAAAAARRAARRRHAPLHP
jgi:hypothetical protein